MDFYFTTTVETHASAVAITSPVATFTETNEASLLGTATTEAEAAASEATLVGTAITEPESATATVDLNGTVFTGTDAEISEIELVSSVFEGDGQTADLTGVASEGDGQTADLYGTVHSSEAVTISMDSTVLDGKDVNQFITGTVVDGDDSPEMSLVGDISEGPDLTLTGNTLTEVGDAQVDYTLTSDTHTEGDVNTTLISVGKTFTSVAFYAQKLTVEEGDDITNNFSMDSFVVEKGSTDIYGTVIETDTAPVVDVVSPMTVFSGGLLSNFDIQSNIVLSDYNANVTLAAYSALLTVPFQQTNDVTVGSETLLSLSTSIENLNFLLTSEVADSGSIRYEVADIDRNLQRGSLRIFPNEWTLSYINNPVDSSGNMNTVSSFLLPILEATYGPSIFTKISLITARNPISGVLYNFVIQDGYRTPSNTVNDFELCYLEDGVFYPVPFMVKSITDEELEIEWDLHQEEI